MAKVTLPLLAVRASGTVGKSVTFGNWKGINYARERVVPGNPKTTAQQAQRNLLAFVVSAWQRAPASVQNSFIASARGAGYTGFNLFSKRNLLSLKGKTSLEDFVASPGQSGANPLSSLTATGGTGQITATAVVGDPIPGSVTDKVHFVAIKDGVPSGALDRNFVASSDNASPYEATFTGLSAGSYVVYAFTECTESAGKTVYSVSLSDTVTVS